jgi:nucleoside-diphosphate-sugar epimerase
LVTGASGLVGIYMLSCLVHIKEKYNVKIFAWVKNEIYKPFEEIFNECNIIKGDITKYDEFKDLSEFDVIIHAAGYGQPMKFTENKLITIEINTTSTIELLKKLKKGGKFLFVSSSELYNGIESTSIKETQIGTTNTDHFRACYIEGKRCGEAICYSFIEKGVDIKIVRLSLAYGPGTKKGDLRVLNSLIQKGLDFDEIKLMDNGDAIRTYCYITDVVEMFWKILLFGKEKVYNVGGESQTSILELANLVAKKLNKKVILPETSNQLVGNPKVVNISTEKYISEFGEKKYVLLENGLQKTINWQKQL